MGFNIDLKNRGCGIRRFTDVFKPIIYGEMKTLRKDFSYLDWTDDLLYVGHPNKSIRSVSFAKQFGKYGVMVFAGVADGHWTPYHLDQCTLEEVEQIFCEACVLKTPIDKLPCFGKERRDIIQEITYSAMLDDFVGKDLNEEDESLYLTALEYLVNKAYITGRIKQLADYYQTKGFVELAQKYYDMNEKYGTD